MNGFRKGAVLVTAGLLALGAFAAVRYTLPSTGTATRQTSVHGAIGQATPARASGVMLVGEVIDLPQGRAIDSVVVSMMDRDYPAVVDGATYSVRLPSLLPGAMATVMVRAGQFEYQSQIGSLRRLARKAGTDRVATVAEVPALRVGMFTTALTAHQQALLADHHAASDEQCEDTLRRGNAVDLANMLFVLNRFRVGRAIPSSFSTYEVLANESVLRNELADVDGNEHYWTSAVGDVAAALPALAPLASASELPADLLLRSPFSSREERPFNGYIDLLSRDAQGTYSFLEQGVGTSDAHHAATLHDGVLSLTPAMPQRTMSVAFVSPYGQIRAVTTVKSVDLKRMVDGDTYDMWSIVHTNDTTYPDNPTVPATTTRSVDFVVGSDFAAATRRDAWTSVAGRRQTLPVTCGVAAAGASPTLTICDTAMHRFDAGGAGVTEDIGYKVDDRMQPKPGGFGQAFTWSVQPDGRLQVQAGGASSTIWSTGGQDGVESIVYVSSRTVGSDTVTTVGQTVSIQPETFPYGDAQVPGTWDSGLIRAWPSQYPDPAQQFYFVRHPDGTGQQYDFYVQYQSIYPHRWSVVGERLYETRYRALLGSGPQFVYDCATAFSQGATACSPVRVRYLRPLRRIGRRVYGIEELHLQTSMQPQGYTGTFNVISTTRPNYYECREGECLAWTSAAYPLNPAWGGPNRGSTTPTLAGTRNADLRIPLR